METETIEVWFGLAMLVALAAPVVAVALARGSLDRKGYSTRFVAGILLLMAASLFAVEYMALLLPALVLHVLIVRWTAMRLNDLQSWRWYALTWFFWPVGLVLAILLTVKRHREDPVLF